MAKILSHGVNIFFNISNNENLKKYQEIARSLGAKIYANMSDMITHMIYEKGNISKLEDATSKGIHVVSPEWLIDCKNNKRKVDELMYSCNVIDSDVSSNERSLTSNSTFNLTLASSNRSTDLLDEAFGSNNNSGDVDSEDDLGFSQGEFKDILDTKVDLGPTLAENIDDKNSEESDEDFDIFASPTPKREKTSNPFDFVSASQDQAKKNDPAKHKPLVQEDSNKDSCDNDTPMDEFDKDIMDSSIQMTNDEDDSKPENSYSTLEEKENDNLNALLNEIETPSLTLTNKISLTPTSDMEIDTSNKIDIKQNEDEVKTEDKELLKDSVDSKQSDSMDTTESQSKTPLRRSKRKEKSQNSEKEEKEKKVSRTKSKSPSSSSSTTSNDSKNKTKGKKTKAENSKISTKNNKKRKADELAEEKVVEKTPKKQKTINSRSKRKMDSNYKIVLSCCTKEIKSEVDQLISKFSDATLLDEFDENATHLIIGDRKRTKKVLLAIAHGKWILEPGWIDECIKSGTWAKESDYEIKDWLKGIVKSRNSHIKNEPPIFAGKRIFIAGQTNTSRNDLKAMIEACGGEIVSGYLSCDICISGKRLYIPMFIDEEDSVPDSPILTEEWILDSISEWKLKDTEDYLAKPKPSRKNS